MKRISIAVLCLGVAACGGSTSAIQEAVRGHLTDPGSAQFGQMVYSRDGNRACVAVNPRNRMGGYAGEQEVLVERSASTGRWSVVTIPAPDCAQGMQSGDGADEILDQVNRSMAEVQAQSDALNASR
jgi:hypothetical protein